LRIFRQDFQDFAGLTGLIFCDLNLNDFVGKVKLKYLLIVIDQIWDCKHIPSEGFEPSEGFFLPITFFLNSHPALMINRLSEN
jgi:hypothetical protein